MTESSPTPAPEQPTPRRYLSVERDLAVVLGRTTDLRAALDAILDAALSLGDVDGGGVYLFDESGDLRLKTHRGLGAPFVEANAFVAREDLRVTIVRRAQPIFTTWTQLSSRRDPVLVEEGLRAVGVIPVLDAGVTVAVLNVASHTCDAISEPVRDALVAIASHIGGVVERVRADEAVRVSQADFQALFDSLNDFLWVLDADGRIVHVNRVVERELGYPREALLGRSVLDVHPEPRRADAMRIVGEMLAGLGVYCPIPLLRADGNLLPVETVVSRGQWNGQPAILGVSRDISRRLAAEEALARSEATHRSIFEEAPIAIVRAALDGHLMHVNPAFQRLLGYPASSAAELDFLRITHPADRAASREAFQRVASGEVDSAVLEKRYLRQDGATLWAKVSVRCVRGGGSGADPDYILAMINDITAQKNLESAQAETERQFRLMADAAPVLIWVVDEQGRATFFNQTWHDFTGRTPLESLGDGWMASVHPDDLEAVQRTTAEAFARRSELTREYRIRHCAGGWRWVLERGRPRHDTEGRFAGYVGSLTDITERKETETERERLVQQLQAALGDVKTLRGLIPVCAWCKNIRNDRGYWGRVEEFIRENSEASVSHGVCPDCARKYFPDYADDAEEEAK